MDSYESTSSIPNLNEDYAEVNYDQLEESLTPPPLDLYGVLNVSKEATEEEIKDAYKRLCRTFHPDKHVNPENKKAAETKFQVIQKAYEGKLNSEIQRAYIPYIIFTCSVLTDPNKRIVYDMFGEEGLSTSWEVGPRLKTPQELREEFERQARLKRQQEVENMIHSKGDIQLSIDATQAFNPYDRRRNRLSTFNMKNFFENTEITQLNMKHSFETQLRPQTQVVIIGQTLLRNGIGGGNIVGTLRHSFSPKIWAELCPQRPHIVLMKTGMYLKNKIYECKIVKIQFLKYIPPLLKSFIIVSAHSGSIYSPPNLVFTGGRVLGKNVTGYLTYKTGAWSLGPWRANELYYRRERSAVAISISGSYEKSGYNFEIQTGIAQSYISLHYNHKLFDDYLVKTSTTLSTTGGLTLVLLGERKITEHTKASLAVEYGFPHGITFKCRISIPILVSPEFNFKIILWGTFLPIITMAAVEQTILIPMRQKKKAEKIAAFRELHAELIENRKREATEATRLLLPSVERKTEMEREKDGLVILEAWYGNVSSLNGEVPLEERSDVIDVKIPVQALVHESQLTIPGRYSKSNIMGFYDPCMGERKQLKIRYQFQRKLHEVTVDDTSPVACPLRSEIATPAQLDVVEVKKHTTSGVKSFLAGGFGGVACVLVGQPFDLIKVRLQTAPEGAYIGMADATRQILVKDGLRGLYRGMGPPLVGITPIFAISFWSYNLGKKVVMSANPNRSSQELSIGEIMIAGGLSAGPTTLIMSPVERVKVLLQIQGQGGVNKYKGPIDVVRQLYKEGGLGSIYRGFGATLARDGPGSAVYYGAYEATKRFLTPANASPDSLNPAAILFAGGMAGVAMWAIAIPPDVIKSRLQTAPPGTYKNALDCLRKTIAQDGTKALFKGLGPALFRAFPANAATFLGYEASLKLMNLLW
ncbi:11680_t:CDS:10 [Funneliformis geosporum]|uniref:11680_t:CDS:1 n=1 Tax=Funneliformis geosporum TaxID=1117311 RepID=A0A9W4SI40_9GLOM|nr:11680_t:CDS:10 [Funneliformis geosporum]